MSKFLLNLLVQISKAFVYSKIQILFGNNFSSDSGPSGPAPSSPSPLRPAGRRACAQPTRPEQPWRICQKAPLLQVCAVRQQRFLSLTSLPRRPHPSDPPPSSRRPTRITSPPRLTAIDRPAPPSLHNSDANQSSLLSRFDSPS
jgi:hypothetical protein